MNDKTPDADRVIAGWQETIREVEANKDGFVEIPRKRIVTTPTQAMDDKTLVERLRDRGVCSIAQNSCRNDYICEEAATRIEALEAELAKAKVPQWFYHPDYTEVCEFSPWDVIDGRYDPEPGNHVFEIECARPLPSIWCAVRVTADPDADERFTFTEHSSEAEAHKALEGSGND